VKYAVLLESQAEKDLLPIPKQVLKRIDAKLQTLSHVPRPKGATKLRGKESEGWRIRVGDYRILYQVDDTDKTIRVYRIRHRREAYR
jgi:mRNA interferase RelE/StbE